ncbi:uncharacterized protein LOC123315227 isoform X2 [Coccinella septempunctata]|uniref:uncharacterized protein LOC123315227 isoform X2 n=1 Tax=Coccinella septempunctata TaxID=41139 RepID=UPI001D0739DF|nr:uncharacterized protein LOC123315227 isoform X2 [Coccinella septempunctata]
MHAEPQFLIGKAKPHEYDIIVREMYRSFYPDEPVSFSLKFRCDPKLDELAYTALDENLSVVVKCKYSGELIAASINRTTNPWDPNLLDRLACTLCSKGKHILHMRAHLMRAHDLWKYYNVQKIFDIQFMFVKREERKQCIPWHLITASRNIASDCGYNIFRIISTNEYLHKVCEKYRMHRSYELPYCAYVGADWQPVCEPPPPHFTARVYVDTNPHLPIKKIEALLREGKLYK